VVYRGSGGGIPGAVSRFAPGAQPCGRPPAISVSSVGPWSSGRVPSGRGNQVDLLTSEAGIARLWSATPRMQQDKELSPAFQRISDIFNSMACKQVERQAYRAFLKLVYETAKDLSALCS
jgi:hypothetical protein